MILDVLENADLYRGLHPRLFAALDYLRTTDLDRLPLGKTVIDGERLFALVQEYTPKPLAECRYEAHQRYWDVQYVARGRERMGWSHVSRMQIVEPYNPDRDVAFFSGAGDLFDVPTGSFAIFGPTDAHMPGIVAGDQCTVRKIVLKVELD